MQSKELSYYSSPPVIASHFTLEEALSSIFPQQSEENRILKTRHLLGTTAKALSDQEIESIITEFEYLIDRWLDEFEMNLFNGMTLGQLLRGKSHGYNE